MRRPRGKKPLPSADKWLLMAPWRLYLLAGIFGFIGLALAVRMVQVQVTDSDGMVSRAQRQHTGSLKVSGMRGRILDRNGVELAVSLSVDSVYARVEDLPLDVPDSLAKLRTALGISPREMDAKLDRNSGFVWLARKVDPRVAESVRALELPGVGFIKEYKRFYPGRSTAGHLLGFVGLDGKGLEGVEQQFDEELRGREYELDYLRDVRGRIVLSDADQFNVDVNGQDIQLTIDRRIQHFAESLLESAVKESGSKAGMVLVQKTQDGEMLAWAVAPAFNPNLYRESKPANWRNRVVTDGYEPGSILKPFLIAAALDNGMFTENTSVYCEEGFYTIHNKRIRDHEPYGNLTLSDILKFSSNIGCAKIAERLGRQNYYNTLQAFGFGRRTGVDVMGEIPGRLASPDRWYPIDLANLSFGQGLLSTPLQLVSAYSALGNRGLLVTPRIRMPLDPKRSARSNGDSNPSTQVIEAGTAQRVLQMMEGVTQKDGTGFEAAVPGYRVAGKTGTAQKYNPELGQYEAGRYLSSFVGLVPADNPQLTILVMLDEPSGKRYYGGQISAPVFREVAARTLNRLGIPPNPDSQVALEEVLPETASLLPEGLGALENLDGDAAIWTMPDFRGLSLRETVKRARRMPVPLRIEGSGRVVEQSPGPGEPLSETRNCAARLAWPEQ